MKRATLTAVAAAAMFGVALLWWATRDGAGIFGDSVTYISVARDVIAGRGLRPMAQYPPLYPLILTLGAPLRTDPIATARVVNAIVLAGTIFLTGLVLYRLNRPPWAVVLGAVLTATSTQLLGMHARIYSEAVFIFVALAGLVVLGESIGKMDRRLMIAAAALIAAATLTRYAGACVIGGGIISLLLFNRRNLRGRAIDAAIFAIVTMLPLLTWIIRNRLIVGSGAPRPLAFHPPTRPMLIQGLDTLAAATLPQHLPGLRLIGGILVAFFFMLPLLALLEGKWRSLLQRSDGPLIFVLLTFIWLYPPFLIFTRTFFEANLPLNYRLLSPMYPPVIVVAAWWLAEQIGPLTIAIREMRIVRIAALSVLLVVAGYNTVRAAEWSIATRSRGLGYASHAWRRSPTIAALRTLPRDTLIYSNAPDVIYVLAKRDAQPVPRTRSRANDKSNARLDEEIRQVSRSLAEHHGVVVFFNALRRADFLISEESLCRELSLKCRQSLSDGRIYSLPSPATTTAP